MVLVGQLDWIGFTFERDVLVNCVGGGWTGQWGYNRSEKGTRLRKRSREMLS